MMPRSISAVLWSLVGLNLITLVIGGLVTWLGYAIPMRLEQFGLRPETIVFSGIASLLSACLGLCALNYSSYLMLTIYGAFCSLYVMVLVFGLPDAWYKSTKYHDGGLVLDIIYYSLVATLIILSAFAFTFSYYLKSKETQRKSLPCTCNNQQLLPLTNSLRNNNRQQQQHHHDNNYNNNNNGSNLNNLSSSSQELNLKDIYMPRIPPYGRLSYPSRTPTATTKSTTCPTNNSHDLDDEQQHSRAAIRHMSNAHSHPMQQQQQQHMIGPNTNSTTIVGVVDSLVNSRVNSSNQMLLGDGSSDPALNVSPPPPPLCIKTIHGNMSHNSHTMTTNGSHNHHHRQQQQQQQQQQHHHHHHNISAQQLTSSTMPRPRSTSGSAMVGGKSSSRQGQSNRYCSSSVAAVTAAAAAALLGGVADGGAWIESGHNHTSGQMDSGPIMAISHCDFDTADTMPDCSMNAPDFYGMHN